MRLNEIKRYSPEVIDWLDKHFNKYYHIAEDGSVNIIGDVSLTHEHFTEFPVKFGKVYGNFNISFCFNLVKLNGPTFIRDHADFEGCHELQTLEDGPTEIGGYFDISRCRSLKNLKGGPVKIGGYFVSNSCPGLVSLEGVAKEILGHNWEIEGCPNLKSLDFVPTKRGPRHISIKDTPIFNLLKFLKIPELKTVTVADTFDIPEIDALHRIIQKYLPLGDLMDCQEELIEAGFSEYARLK
jgi:hypothetical protein